MIPNKYPFVQMVKVVDDNSGTKENPFHHISVHLVINEDDLDKLNNLERWDLYEYVRDIFELGKSLFTGEGKIVFTGVSILR